MENPPHFYHHPYLHSRTPILLWRGISHCRPKPLRPQLHLLFYLFASPRLLSCPHSYSLPIFLHRPLLWTRIKRNIDLQTEMK